MDKLKTLFGTFLTVDSRRVIAMFHKVFSTSKLGLREQENDCLRCAARQGWRREAQRLNLILSLIIHKRNRPLGLVALCIRSASAWQQPQSLRASNLPQKSTTVTTAYESPLSWE